MGKDKEVYEDENDQILALCTDGVLTITEIPKEEQTALERRRVGDGNV